MGAVIVWRGGVTRSLAGSVGGGAGGGGEREAGKSCSVQRRRPVTDIHVHRRTMSAVEI